MNARLTTSFLLLACLPLGGCAISIGDEVAAPRAGVATQTASLTVQFRGIETPSGSIMMSVFDSESAHDGGGEPARVAMADIEGTTANAVFEGLAPGEYAVKAFHDVDGDGTMDTNPFGMPIEPFAFSNDAPAKGGPARWEAARFPVVEGANRITITIK